MAAAGDERSLVLTGSHRSRGRAQLEEESEDGPGAAALPGVFRGHGGLAGADPLRVGDEVEVRLDADGFFGTWYEATVVGLDHARGRRRSEPRYTVAYSRVRPDDGAGLPNRFAPTQIRPRPPTPATSSPPRFLVHDIVEALDRGGWWSGIVVVAAAADGAAVTVAFPITGEVTSFAPHSVRPRRDYVDGEWVPSRAVVAEEAQPKRVLKVYHVGEKVEVWKNREVYGYSWFAATVTKVVDPFSYVLEYSEQEVEKKATDYLCWNCIRPAMDRSPREGRFKLVPGAAVEAYCDGAWAPGVLQRMVGEDEYEVRVNKGEASRMVTKVVELLKPDYRWDGNRWSIVKPKRKANSRHHCSGTKKARKELQRQEVIHAPVSESHESPARNHCANYCYPLPESKGGKTHSLQALQGEKDISGHLKENRSSCMKESNSALTISPECQISSAETRQVSIETNKVSSSKMTVYTRRLKKREGLKEPETLQSPVNVTSAVENTERKKAAGVDSDTPSNLFHKGVATTINSICQVIRNEDVLTDNTATQEANNNHIMETPTLYPSQHDGGNVNEKSIVLDLQNAGSSQCTTENNILCAGSSLPSNLPASQISSCHHAEFDKSSPPRTLFEAMDVLKNAPQQPHFRPLQVYGPALREGMVLGLTKAFFNSVEVIRNLSLADSVESIEEIRSDLDHLKDNGFNVEYLQTYLDRLVKIRTDNTRHLEEKANLEAQMLKNTTSLSEIDSLLVENDKAVAELEKNLSELKENLSERRCKGQKIAKDKEHSDAELSRLKAAHNSVDEACRDDKQQFCSILAELQRKHLT